MVSHSLDQQSKIQSFIHSSSVNSPSRQSGSIEAVTAVLRVTIRHPPQTLPRWSCSRLLSQGLGFAGRRKNVALVSGLLGATRSDRADPPSMFPKVRQQDPFLAIRQQQEDTVGIMKNSLAITRRAQL